MESELFEGDGGGGEEIMCIGGRGRGRGHSDRTNSKTMSMERVRNKQETRTFGGEGSNGMEQTQEREGGGPKETNR